MEGILDYGAIRKYDKISDQERIILEEHYDGEVSFVVDENPRPARHDFSKLKHISQCTKGMYEIVEVEKLTKKEVKKYYKGLMHPDHYPEHKVIAWCKKIANSRHYYKRRKK